MTPDEDNEREVEIGPIRERSVGDDLWDAIAAQLPPNMRNERTAHRIGFLIGLYGAEAVFAFLRALGVRI